MKRYRILARWLIIGLELPILSLTGLFLGLRLSGDRLNQAGFVGMVVGGTLGLIAGSLILYMISHRGRVGRKR